MHTILYPVNQFVIGGAEQQLLELVRGLDKSAFHPIVAPLYPGGGLEEEFAALDGVEIIPLNRRGKFDPRPLWTVTRLLRRRRIDIVQPFLTPATFFGLLPALTREATTTIVTERCGVRQSRGIGYKSYRTVEDLFSHLADAIVPNSVAGQQMLIERGLPREKIRVIYNGINLDRLSINREAATGIRAAIAANKDVTIAGMLASLTPAKGHATAIRAMATLRERRPDLRLAIVGDGPRGAELKALCEDLHLTDRVTFFGYRRNVSDFLASFDLLLSASSDNEGTSNSILEAMALGVPVVATDIGGNREVVTSGVTGYLVPPNDQGALANAIETAIDAPEQTQAMAARARDRVNEQFSLTRMIGDYEDLYRQLLSRSVRIADADGRLVTVRG